MKGSTAALRASAFFALFAAVSATAAVVAPVNASAAAVDPSHQRCQQTLASASRVYLERVLAARIRCENRVVRSAIPPTDCLFGAGDERLQRVLQAQALKLDRRLPAACAGVNLIFLGFPGLCPDPTGAPFDTADLEQCVVAQSGTVIAALLGSYYPPQIDFYRGPAAACVSGSAKDALAMFRLNIRARHHCLLGQAVSEIDAAVNCRADIQPYGSGTSDDRVDQAVRRAYLPLLGGIPAQCGAAQIDGLGYQQVCADSSGGTFTVSDLKACLFNKNREQTPPTLVIAFPTAPVCGNAHAEGDEQCDNGDSNSDTIPDACRTDCTNPRCGDSITDSGEQCDDGNTASLDGCLPTCIKEVCGDGVVNNNGTEQCDDGDANSDSEPDACREDCTPHRCGDSVTDGGEQCDNGAANSNTKPDACRTNCSNPRCGDTVTDPGSGEQCDDGNSASLDGCLPTCIKEVCGDGVVNNSGTEQCDDGDANSDTDADACRENCKNPRCGDAAIDTGEQCDNGAANSDSAADACRTNCTPARCGDAVTDSGEQCDDGNSASLDGCLPTCIREVCGDGVINNNGTEQCDNGDANSDTVADACRENCQNPRCGDSVTDSGEQCDDGNSASLDGCLPTCISEFCGDGVVNNSGTEQCDNGANNSNTEPNACRTDCTPARCGDSVTDGGEQCDDGPANSDTTPDACRTTCSIPRCGDTVTDPGNAEQCDDGNTDETDACRLCILCGNGLVTPPEQCDDGAANSDTTPDACRTSCLDPACGDAVTDPGNAEQCDDGNTVSNDDCSSTCKIESCGDGIVQTKEQCDGDAGPCGAGEGCSSGCTCDLACPGFGELTLYSGVGSNCASNEDCVVGQCDPGLGRCRTATQLDSGWTGLSHDADINNLIVTHGYLECAGAGPACGVCDVVGLDPAGGSCRCSNNTRTICDQPFAADAVNCGGAVCDCYFGAPFPLSSAGTPACIVNRFSQDISGTANVDLGAGHIAANLRTQVFLGITTTTPCPVCGGRCSDNAAVTCVFDSDCASGTCQLDPVVGDGLRGGVCIDGRNAGLGCDVTALNTSFPALPSAQGGGGYSLDCLPDTGKNVSGSGLVIILDQTTGSAQLDFNVPCGNGSEFCPCRQCTTDNTVSCNSDAECASQPGGCSVASSFHCATTTNCKGINAGNCLGIKRCQLATAVPCTTNTDCASVDLGVCNPSTCNSNGAGVVPSPNDCDEFACSDVGGGEGECTTGPDGTSCDAVVRANGMGVLSCATNDDCSPEAVGIPAGSCTLVERRNCFLDPIVATGHADPAAPIGAAAFCIPPTSSPAINSVAGLPGPGRTVNQASSRLFCESDPSRRYTPGVGGCLD
ncbi:MAG: DUF4215 domain-containing protein [Deltaproteobacteria bacterium]|nr:DUF4215 domain-containing protein [Deltaproteobacteria bacterium]